MKKKKTTLRKKLKPYSALAGSILVVGSADAQIVYTNITDYTATQNGDTYQLDLNNDGTNDYDIKLTHIKSTGGTADFVMGVAASANLMASNSTGGLSCLTLNANIGAGNLWNAGSNGLPLGFGNGSIAFGPWVSAVDRYAGFKFVKNSKNYYGWARMDMNNLASSFTIKDYAYEMTADKAIKAGDKGSSTSVAELKNLPARIFSSDNNITVVLDELNASEKTTVSIKNVLGQEVRNAQITDKNTVIDMQDQPSGIYFATVTSGDKSSTVKVYLQ